MHSSRKGPRNLEVLAALTLLLVSFVTLSCGTGCNEVVAPQSMRLGMIAILPGIPPADRPEATAQAVAASGARDQRPGTAYLWSVAEPSPGVRSFSSEQDRLIEIAEAKSLQVLPSLAVGAGWMTSGSGNSKSYPPSDLATTPDPEYGYSRTYFDFVTAWITHYRGHFEWVVIENEENSTLFWGGSADEYVRLLETAVLAIHAVDPDVRVADGGLVSTLFGLCAPRHWIATGKLTPDEAHGLMVDFFARAAATGANRWVCTTADECAAQLSDPRVDEECQEAETILAGVAGAADAVNFHFYEDWSVLHLVTEWLDEMAHGLPVLSNETGQRGDLAYAQGAGLAEDLVKTLVTARFLGLSSVVWWTADTIGTPAPSPDKVSPLGPDGTDRPAAVAFRLLADLLGRYEPERIQDQGPQLYRYVFQGGVLQAVWSESGETSVATVAPLGKTRATVIGVDGSRTEVPISNGTVVLTVGPSPIFLLLE